MHKRVLMAPLQLAINNKLDPVTNTRQVQIFETIQGEGIDKGVPAFFIRLQGCSVRCYFCDEKSAWKPADLEKDKTEKKNIVSHMSSAEIISELQKINPKLKRVVITGGEPTEQDLSDLIYSLQEQGYKVSIETAATGKFTDKLLQTCFDGLHITFSPKEAYSQNGKPATEEIWSKATEIKFVISNEVGVDYLLKTILPKHSKHCPNSPIYLSADWYDFDINKECILKLCSEYPEQLRMGIQMHKYLEIA